jgi:molybdenum storage protein
MAESSQRSHFETQGDQIEADRRNARQARADEVHATDSPYRVTPELNVVKIGGHGIIDYGRSVVMPLIDEIGQLSRQHQILVVTGGGTRVRHIMDLGLDLGMPTGVLSELAGKISEQNAIMLSILLSEHGGVRIKRDDLLELPMLFRLGSLPVTHGTLPSASTSRRSPRAGYRRSGRTRAHS